MSKLPIDLRPHKVRERNTISIEKKKDVNSLLVKHFRAEWRPISSSSFFVHILSVDLAAVTVEDEADEPCELLEELPELMVYFCSRIY